VSQASGMQALPMSVDTPPCQVHTVATYGIPVPYRALRAGCESLQRPTYGAGTLQNYGAYVVDTTGW
jgi:hypothetical protein